MRALLVKPLQKPEVVEVENTLKSLQEMVGGYIEVIYPFDDMVGLVCNEESKLCGLALNRSLKDENGKIYDVIAGIFLIVGLGEDDFESLSDEMIEKYYKLYLEPKVFVRYDDEIKEFTYKKTDEMWEE